MRRVEWWQDQVSSIDRWRDISTFSFHTFFYNISSSIDARDLILPPFDAPHRGDSNEPSFVLLRSLDDEIFTFLSVFWSFGVSKNFKASKLVLKGNFSRKDFLTFLVLSHSFPSISCFLNYFIKKTFS